MESTQFYCHLVTPFGVAGDLDEGGLRAQLQRVIGAGNAVFVGSPGAGESNSLSFKELSRVYEIGAEEGRGRVPVWAAVRESRTAEQTLEVASLAVKAGVDVVQLHQLDGGHGMVPTEREQEAYFDWLLTRIDHPASISVYTGAFGGYVAPAELIVSLFRRHDHLVGCSVVGPPHRYLQAILSQLPESVQVLTGGDHFLHELALGAKGTQGPYGNLMPKTSHMMMQEYDAGDLAAFATHYRRFVGVVDSLKPWHASGARSLKSALHVLHQGNGVLRPPYLLPSESELDLVRGLLVKSGITEWEEIPDESSAV